MNTLITEDREAGAAAQTEPVVYEHNTLFFMLHLSTF